MPLKGYVFYFCCPMLLYVLSRMIHPAFYFVLVVYCLAMMKYLSKSYFVFMLITLMVFVCIFHIPSSQVKTQISGRVVGKDEKSIVVKEGYYKTKVYGEFEDVDIDDDIALSGTPYTINSFGNDYEFNYQTYLYSLNIFQTLTLSKVEHIEHHNTLYQSLKKRIESDERYQSFVSLFILGTKDEQMKETYDQLADMSFVHLFALSGMHLNILKKWLKMILKFIFPERIQEVVAVVLIGIYIYIIPYNISLLRAYLMLALPLLFHRYFNKLDLFSMVTVGMLLYNPYLIFHLSFIFSYTIYFMVLLMEGHKNMKYEMVLATIPIMLCVNHKINIVTLCFGFLLAPLVEILYQLILYYLVFGSFVGIVMFYVYQGFESIVHFLHSLSYYLYFARPNIMFIGVYYYLYMKMILKVNMKRSRQKELCCLLGLIIAFYFYPFYNIKGKVVMISVGQGDCFFIQQPLNKGNILIDTGGLKNKDVAKDVVLPYLYSQGVSNLDAVFISHDDYDHCGSLDSLKKEMKIKKIIKNFKEEKIGDLTFKNIALNKGYSDINNQSSIIYVTIHRLNYLFTGDIAMEAEKDLYDTYGKLDVDVLKVSHHGSASSTSSYLMKMIQPKVALISVGKNNSYHHPSFTTIERLKDHGVHIYRSDQDGMVTIQYDWFGNYIYS